MSATDLPVPISDLLPFDDMKPPSMANEERKRFIDRPSISGYRHAPMPNGV
jgi:hypothetical protein